MHKFKKILIIPPGYAAGDNFCIVSLAHYLLEFYEKVYLGMENEEYFRNYIKNDPNYNTRLFLANRHDYDNLLNQSVDCPFHICNVFTGCWERTDFQLFDHPNVDKEFYFNDRKYLYEKIDIPLKYRHEGEIHLQENRPKTEVNHVIYYKLAGLNNQVRLDYFNYHRNIDEENAVKEKILKQYNLNNTSNYNIINNSTDTDISSRITNGLPCINMHHLAHFPGLLMKLVEDAEEIHLVEGSNVNLLYLSQYKNIFKYNKPIHFHVWARNRDWPGYNMDKAYKMMTEPTLDNWFFYF